MEVSKGGREGGARGGGMGHEREGGARGGRRGTRGREWSQRRGERLRSMVLPTPPCKKPSIVLVVCTNLFCWRSMLLWFG